MLSMPSCTHLRTNSAGTNKILHDGCGLHKRFIFKLAPNRFKDFWREQFALHRKHRINSPDRQHVVSGETVLLSIRHRRDKTMAGYAQVTLVGVDLDHVTTSRHDPQAAEYGGTVTLRARSRGIDFTYAYPFSNKTSVLDAIDGATKSLLSELDSLSRACMDVTRQERDAIDEGDQNTEGPGDDL
jgi:hypothetical protein